MTSKYLQVSASALSTLIDEFLLDRHLISGIEFDQFFDRVSNKLRSVGVFSEDVGFKADFSSSRYVDQFPYINVVVLKPWAPKEMLNIATDVLGASGPFALSFEYSSDMFLALPGGRLYGTIPEQNLEIPLK